MVARPFIDSIVNRIRADIKFKRALKAEAREALVKGDEGLAAEINTYFAVSTARELI